MKTAKQRVTVTAILSVAFAIIFFALVINGGMCERYERKMLRQQLMREYLDSQRAMGQRKILERSQQDQADTTERPEQGTE